MFGRARFLFKGADLCKMYLVRNAAADWYLIGQTYNQLRHQLGNAKIFLKKKGWFVDAWKSQGMMGKYSNTGITLFNQSEVR